ncbi:nucleotidyltransferase domain-containing protein [Candidatus Peregrinibacteria bacterium]|nr:MAG: nucleotidyltransferase domain-containing protein [Candidatus Peregrinibacteria bacterium]
MSDSNQIIEKVCDYLKDKPVLRAYLFGSYARGEQTEESDVDILVELDHSVPIGLEFLSMKKELNELLNRPVDFVSYGGLSKYVKPYIEKEKVLFYERQHS